MYPFCRGQRKRNLTCNECTHVPPNALCAAAELVHSSAVSFTESLLEGVMPNPENEELMPPAPAATSRATPVAPVWHTIVLLVVLIGLAAAQGFPRLSNPA